MNKKRTIIATVVMVLIILLLIILVIAASMRKPAGEIKTGNSIEIGVTKQEDHTVKNDVKDENLPPVSNSNDSASIKSEEKNDTETTGKSETKSESKSESETQNQTGKGMMSTSIDISEESFTESDNGNLPKSGPESILPLALVLGALTTFVASCLVVHDKRLI